MRLRAWVGRLYRDERRLSLAVLGGMVVFYGTLLCIHPDQTPELNRTFNSMLEHLLKGRFDVDPGTVGNEGFLYGGRVYSYWGIFCALLRLPLAAIGRMNVDVTVWSCLCGVCLAGMAKVRTLLLVRRHVTVRTAEQWAFGLMLLYILFGGSELAYLRASIFQEVIFWAVGFAAVFVSFAVEGLMEGEFSPRILNWMAAMAGLTVLTRVSTGVGLVAALLLLLAWLTVQDVRSGRRWLTWQRMVPLAILAALLAATGTVNYFRWGHAWTFADYRYYLMNLRYPGRMPRMRLYGLFNVRRIPFGLGYYFAPLWAVRGNGGRLLFEAMQTRMMDAVELPPSSFFLTDLYPLTLALLLGVALRARGATRWLADGRLAVLALGLATPCVLMLTTISMNYRYRMEFYPEIDLLAFVGLYVSLKDEAARQRLERWKGFLKAAALVSVLASMVMLGLYKMSDYGPSQAYLRKGLVGYYEQVLRP